MRYIFKYYSDTSLGVTLCYCEHLRQPHEKRYLSRILKYFSEHIMRSDRIKHTLRDKPLPTGRIRIAMRVFFSLHMVMYYFQDYYPDLIANDSIAFLRASKRRFARKPVLLVMSFPAPHGPEDSAPQYSHLFFNVTTHQ